MSRATAESEHQTQKDQSNQDEDLQSGHPELELAKILNAKIVDDRDHDQEESNKDTGIYSFRGNPVLEDKRRGSELIWGEDDIFEPVPVCGLQSVGEADMAMFPQSHCIEELVRNIRPAQIKPQGRIYSTKRWRIP